MDNDFQLCLHESGHLSWLLFRSPQAVVTVRCEADSLVCETDTPPSSFEELLCDMVAGAVAERVFANKFDEVFVSGGWRAVMQTECAHFDLEQLEVFAAANQDAALNAACLTVAQALASSLSTEMIQRVAKINSYGLQASFRNKDQVIH